MKALLKLYRVCFATIAVALIAGLSLATPAMAAEDVVTFAAYWGQPFSTFQQKPQLVRYGDYDQPWCPLDATCFNQKMSGKWTYQVVSGSNNLCADKQWWSTPTGAFDIDSYPGRTKRCETVVLYGGRIFIAAQGSAIPYHRPVMVHFGMFDSNGSPTGTFASKIMAGPGMTCIAKEFGVDPSTAAGKACFISPLPLDSTLPWDISNRL